MLHIGWKKFLLLAELKMQFRGLMLLVIWMVKRLLEGFYKKQLQKTNQKKFRIEKVLKRKGDRLYVKWKGYDSRFNSSIDKKSPCIKMSQ